MQLRIKVIPGASIESLEWLGELLKVKVRAPPDKGRANAAVEELLAERLAVPATSVRIIAGFGSPLKTVEIASIADLNTLRKKLN
jgi:uncharacterized protein YggU (UPF0235/DUF167 family)